MSNKTGNQASIWSGVYKRFDEIEKPSQIFDTDLWIKKQQAQVLSVYEATRGKNKLLPDNAWAKDYPLATALASLLTTMDKLNVLDYGGAMGQTYFDICAKLPHASERINYTICEVPSIVDAIPDQIKEIDNLKFIKSCDEINTPQDVVHCGSVLQYIEEWQKFFTTLFDKLKPKTFVLSDLLVGETPAFVTAQNYYDRVMPVQCLNINEFIKFWETHGYALFYRSRYTPLENRQYFPSHDLPDSHKIKSATHLIFSRK